MVMSPLVVVVSINGVVQTNIAYTSTGTGGRTITFSSGMTVGDVVRLQHLGFHPTYVAVGDNSVTTTKILNNAFVPRLFRKNKKNNSGKLIFNYHDLDQFHLQTKKLKTNQFLSFALSLKCLKKFYLCTIHLLAKK